MPDHVLANGPTLHDTIDDGSTAAGWRIIEAGDAELVAAHSDVEGDYSSSSCELVGEIHRLGGRVLRTDNDGNTHHAHFSDDVHHDDDGHVTAHSVKHNTHSGADADHGCGAAARGVNGSAAGTE